MIRKIIKIDEEKCNGCALCAEACHEGAIGMVDGKAKLLRDDYCDGLGDCLPVCPTGAITFEELEALEYNEALVKARMAKKEPESLACGCPGTMVQSLKPETPPATEAPASNAHSEVLHSQLRQWPVQIKLVPTNAPYFDGAHLLIAADCAAYAHADFHRQFMKDRITLIGCPKLDMVDYSEKLSAILEENNIKSVTVVRMQVPCCGGIEQATINALKNSQKMIPWQVVTLSTDGSIMPL